MVNALVEAAPHIIESNLEVTNVVLAWLFTHFG